MILISSRRSGRPATILLFAHGPTMFWIFGLILCLWVGPAQSSSRSFLARLAPVGREGQMFGLYATTGRAVSFLAPGLFALFSGVFSDRVGIIGIALVLLAGAVVALARSSRRRTAAKPQASRSDSCSRPSAVDRHAEHSERSRS